MSEWAKKKRNKVKNLISDDSVQRRSLSVRKTLYLLITGNAYSKIKSAIFFIILRALSRQWWLFNKHKSQFWFDKTLILLIMESRGHLTWKLYKKKALNSDERRTSSERVVLSVTWVYVPSNKQNKKENRLFLFLVVEMKGTCWHFSYIFIHFAIVVVVVVNFYLLIFFSSPLSYICDPVVVVVVCYLSSWLIFFSIALNKCREGDVITILFSLE